EGSEGAPEHRCPRNQSSAAAPGCIRLRRLSAWPCGFELVHVLECLPGVAAKDRLAEETEGRSEEDASRVLSEFALPDHLDSASLGGWRCSQFPAAAGDGVHVRVGDRRLDQAGLRPVVAAALPAAADAGWGAFGDVSPGITKRMHVHLLERHCWEDLC